MDDGEIDYLQSQVGAQDARNQKSIRWTSGVYFSDRSCLAPRSVASVSASAMVGPQGVWTAVPGRAAIGRAELLPLWQLSQTDVEDGAGTEQELF